MAEKVDIWNRDEMKYVESEKYYETYTITAIQKAGRTSNIYDAGVTLTLYVDEETGIIVTDVRAYEQTEAKHG